MLNKAAKFSGGSLSNSSSPGQALSVLGALTGGLLSSSCCVLQLLLNYTSIGCAGFSALTPYRNVFRLITGSFLSYLLLTQGANRRTLTTVALSLMLMGSQDLLAAHNKGKLNMAGLQQLLADFKLLLPGLHGLGETAGAGGTSKQLQQPAAQKVTLKVQGMRCEACAARLRSNLAALDGVDGCTVQRERGIVEVWSNSSSSSSSSSAVQTQLLLEAVLATDDSYTAELLGRDCYDAQEQPLPCPPTAGSAEDPSV